MQKTSLIVKPNLHRNDEVGQLGNKMFILAAMYGWAKEHNADLAISDWGYSNVFPMTKKYIRSDYAANYAYVESQFNYMKIPYINGTLALHGYFQSEKYFEHCKADIIQLFAPELKVAAAARKVIEGLDDLCSIHIRRTDYLNEAQKNYHGNMTLEYYQNAMSKVKSKNYIIFSDDIAWCKQNLVGDNIFYSENQSNVVDLIAMAMCKNNIIANSSFSWWGSYLNPNPNKIIIAPKNWFGPTGHKEYSDVYTKDMVLV